MDDTAKVLTALQDSAEPLKAAEVAEKLQIDKAVVDKCFKELKKEGKIESPKRCYYTAVK